MVLKTINQKKNNSVPRHPRIVAYFRMRQQIGRVLGHQNADQIDRTLHLQVAKVESSGQRFVADLHEVDLFLFQWTTHKWREHQSHAALLCSSWENRSKWTGLSILLWPFNRPDLRVSIRLRIGKMKINSYLLSNSCDRRGILTCREARRRSLAVLSSFVTTRRCWSLESGSHLKFNDDGTALMLAKWQVLDITRVPWLSFSGW